MKALWIYEEYEEINEENRRNMKELLSPHMDCGTWKNSELPRGEGSENTSLGGIGEKKDMKHVKLCFESTMAHEHDSAHFHTDRLL